MQLKLYRYRQLDENDVKIKYYQDMEKGKSFNCNGLEIFIVGLVYGVFVRKVIEK